jgi:tetratricopeptide (TPR) repeat protein
MTVLWLALALAVPAALFVAWPVVRGRGAPALEPDDDQAAALQGEKTLALRALRELELDHENGLLAEPDYAHLRARYEARAGAIIEQLDRLVPRPRPAASAAAQTPAGRPVPWTQRPAVLAAGGVGLLLFGVALGMLVVRHSDPTPPEPAAAAASPAPPPGAAGGAGGARGPLSKEMLAGMLQAAHASLDAGRYQEAISAYKAVLQREPDNVDAITHLGVILALAGHADAALEAFDRALAIDPSYAHALWDKARVLYEQRQDYAGAIAAWERFVEVAPPGQDRDQAQARIRETRARLAAGPAPAAPASGGRSSP